MRGSLGVVLSACLLVGCGGAEAETPIQPEQEAPVSSFQTTRCDVECYTGPNEGATTRTYVSTRSQCESFAMSFCSAAYGGTGGYWWLGQFYGLPVL